MASLARRIVSGKKARFKDPELGTDLDLCYLTDRVIIMGYPAYGLAAMYRNDRNDARRFIEKRHAEKYWIFNFCPLTENSYDPSFFRGRVSRYPFPDHHAPPFALLALAVREMHAFLSQDAENVVVVHCKAGKGRSGTLACAYLLTLPDPPSSPALERSMTRREWAERRAAEVLRQAEEQIGTDDEEQIVGGDETGSLAPERKSDVPSSVDVNGDLHEDNASSTSVLHPALPLPSSLVGASSSTSSLEQVLSLHTSRRMKPPRSRSASPSVNPATDIAPSEVRRKYGVSIASQRRFLQYWATLLSGSAPSSFWSDSPSREVRLTKLVVRMVNGNKHARRVVGLINTALSPFSNSRHTSASAHSSSSAHAGDIWASVARYDPQFEAALEQRERDTRGSEWGRAKEGTDGKPDVGLQGVLESGKWDQAKMIRGCGRFTGGGQQMEDGILQYTLRPAQHAAVDADNWVKVKNRQEDIDAPSGDPAQGEDDDASTASSVSVTKSPSDVILSSQRAVRIKLFTGQIPMGWFWFIPCFEMSQPGSEGPYHAQSTFALERQHVDFPLGPGTWLIDVTVELEWT